MLPTLANAGDLAQWANRLDAPGYLPKLIRSLILATAGDITRLDMRSGEGIRYPGYMVAPNVRLTRTFREGKNWYNKR